jgi:hypothetical protein
MSYREGFLVYTQQPTGVEFSVPVRHIVKVSYAAATNITKLDFIDGSSESFTTTTDAFYLQTKKEIFADLHPTVYSTQLVSR